MIEFTQKKIGPLNCVIGRSQTAAEKVSAIVILLHGYGDSPNGFHPLCVPFVQAGGKLNDAIYVVPEAPLEWDPGQEGRAWWPLDMMAIQMSTPEQRVQGLLNNKPQRLEQNREAINTIINQLTTAFELEAKNVLIGGFSQGAMLSTDVALNFPETLGGLVIWSGSLLNESEWAQAASQREPLTIVQAHGRSDDVLPFKGAVLLRDMLKQNNHDIEFIEFPENHTIPESALVPAIELGTRIANREA